jgi:hypothetical protein
MAVNNRDPRYLTKRNPIVEETSMMVGYNPKRATNFGPGQYRT